MSDATGVGRGRKRGDREGWDFARQVAESKLRDELAGRGIDVPRQCVDCGSALEALREGPIGVTVRCVEPCSRADGRSAYRHLRSTGAATLPGFDRV